MGHRSFARSVGLTVLRVVGRSSPRAVQLLMPILRYPPLRGSHAAGPGSKRAKTPPRKVVWGVMSISLVNKLV